MRAIILCGGYGKKLRPLTWLKPKCMVRVNGKPVLEHIVNHLRNHGINEIYVNLHYKPKQVMDYFGTSLVYLYEPKLLGEEGTISALYPYINNDWCVVVNGDTLTNLDINKMFSLSWGKEIKYMDGDIYAGVRIIPPNYLPGEKFTKYQDTESYWIDMGTFEGLRKAQKLI